MLRWLKRLLGVPSSTPAPQSEAVGQEPVTQPPISNRDAHHISTLSWMLQVGQPLPLPLQSWEQQPLTVVKDALAQPALPPNLVPRAAAVIPQLLRLLRQEYPSRHELVDRIRRDTLLTTEVLRLARSPFFGAGQSVESLETAVSLIGIAGLQSAIAKVVLKPLFAAHASGLAAKAGPRLWAHADQQSTLASDLAVACGLDRFDGFLVGLLHGAGRTAMLRLLDRAGAHPEWPCSVALDTELEQASHRLFGRLMQDWAISPKLAETGQQLAAPNPVIQPDTLAWIVMESERQATRALSGSSQSPNMP